MIMNTAHLEMHELWPNYHQSLKILLLKKENRIKINEISILNQSFRKTRQNKLKQRRETQ